MFQDTKAKIHERLLKASKKVSRKGLYEFLDYECTALPDNIHVLNVGAGGEVEQIIGRFAELKNWSCVSLDIDEKRKPDMLGSIEHFNGQTESYDAVFLIEVLEHVENPMLALTNIKRILKFDGRLVMSTPFLFPIHDAPFDYFRYTENGLQLLLGDFSDVCINARNGYFESINVQIMRVLKSAEGMSIFSLAIAFLSIFVFKFLALMGDHLIKLDIGTTGYTAVAVKLE